MCRLGSIHALGLVVLFLLIGCSSVEIPMAVPLRYAKLLRMTEQPDYIWTEVVNPWDTTQVLHQYLLIDKGVSSEKVRTLQTQHKTAVVVRTPLQRSLMQSTVHASLALKLGAQQQLVGLCDTAYIVAPELKRLHLSDFGRGDQPNVERIIAAQTDACWFAPFEEIRYTSLDRANIPVIDCADYLETTPLGRAEWMRFYGRLWGKSQLADSLFEEEVRQYEDLAQKIKESSNRSQSSSEKSRSFSKKSRNFSEKTQSSSEKSRSFSKKSRNFSEKTQSSSEKSQSSSRNTRNLSHKPRVWLDLPWQSTWYVPGGKSYLSALIADAGGDYALQHNDKSGSLPLPLERAWKYAQQAEVWIIKGGQEVPSDYAELSQLSRVYAHFPAVRSHRVWVCNTMQVPYYEQTPFSPALLLREWCQMLGTLTVDSATSLRYFHPLSR